MKEDYTRENMVSYLKEYFDSLKFSVYEYSEKIPFDKYDVRVPLFCIKGTGKERQEIFIEVVTESIVTKEAFFSDIARTDILAPDSSPEQRSSDIINDVSPMHFYRYYFPWAQVYYALPTYATGKETYKNFEKTCKENNIGLIKVTELSNGKGAVEILYEPLSLTKDFNKKIENACVTDKKLRTQKIEDEIKNHFQEVLDYLVFYPDPRFRRRSIVARGNRISLFLINKLLDTQKLGFAAELNRLSTTYRTQTNSDYEIAGECIKELWHKYLGLSYPSPEIQEKFEEIFLKEYRYREHFLHQFQVFLLGSIVIDKLYYSSDKEVFEKFNLDFKIAFETVWLAASTYHDYNYSTQKYQSWFLEYLIEVLQMDQDDVKKELSKLNLDFAAVRENFLQTAQRILNVLTDKLKLTEDFKEALYIFLYEKLVAERNHALTSGVTLLKIYKKTPQNQKRILSGAIEQAAFAISLHDEQMWEYFCGCKGQLLGSNKKECKSCQNRKWHHCKPYEKEIKAFEILKSINFKDFPLLYLLIICDSCQDEGRCNENTQAVRTIIDDLEINENGEVTITLIAKDDTSYNLKSSEFKRVEQFLNDGKFTVNLKLEHSTKKTSFTL